MAKDTLSEEQKKHYITLAFYYNREAEEILLEYYKPYVIRIAKKVLVTCQYSSLIDIHDLVQEGMLGLLDALHHFVPEDANRFLTNVGSKIRSTMLHYIQKSLHADSVNIVGNCSLYSCVRIEDEKSLEEEQIMQCIVDELYQSGIISEVEKKVLILRYQYGFSLADIAKEFEMSRAGISKIEHRALLKLKNYLILNKIVEVDDFQSYELGYFNSLTGLKQLRYILYQVVVKERDYNTLCNDLQLDQKVVMNRLIAGKHFCDATLYSQFIALKIGGHPSLLIGGNPIIPVRESQKEESLKMKHCSFVQTYYQREITDKTLLMIASEIVNGKLLRELCQIYQVDSKLIYSLFQHRLRNLSTELYNDLVKLGYINLPKSHKKKSYSFDTYRK